MAIFFLSRNDPDGPPQEWRELHERAGFDRSLSFAANDWTLWLWGKLDGSGPHYVKAGKDFAACTGIFFYKGKRLEGGLQRLLDDFDGTTFPWADCRGHYAVVLFKQGHLFLASDELGAYRIYRNAEGSRFSSSFSALRATLPETKPDTQGIYEYVFNGATFGEKTLLQDVKQQREGVMYSLAAAGAPRTSTPPIREAAPGPRTIDEATEEYVQRLRSLFGIYVGEQRQFRIALSGGYDSRLVLALLLDAGVQPALYVYGNDADSDVRIAKEIARGEGLELEQIDKDELERTPKAPIDVAWARFDSWSYCGLFDNGVDAEDRRTRARGGMDVVNGGGGECFRNFFYLRDGSYRPEEIVWSFYSRYDPRWLTPRFRKDEYVGALAEDMRLALPGKPRQAKLSRHQVEDLYPRFRVRYWTGREAGLNQRFGPLLFPFLEPALFAGTERIPLTFKDYGRLEGRMIRKISPRLARYRSAYGFPLEGEPPALYRLKMQMSFWRPVYLRQFSAALKSRLGVGRRNASVQGLPGLERVDPRLPALSSYLRIDRIANPDVLNRAATLELMMGSPSTFLAADVVGDTRGSSATGSGLRSGAIAPLGQGVAR